MSEPGQSSMEEIFLAAIYSPELKGIAVDWIDTAAGLPVASSLQQLWSLSGSIREYYFRRKVACFLRPLAEVPPEVRERQLARLVGDSDARGRFSGQLLQLLERLDDERKSKVSGNLSVGLLSGDITLAEFWRMNRAVEVISLDEEWPILQVIERYKEKYYDGRRPRQDNWRHEGVLLSEVNQSLGQSYTDGDLSSIVLRLNQTALFVMLGWREGPAHDCWLVPLYFKFKKYMAW